MVFIAFVVASLILIKIPDAVWGVPVGLIIALCSEAEFMTNMKK